MTHVSAVVFDPLRRSLSSNAVDASEETIPRYGQNLLPGGDRLPAGVVYRSRPQRYRRFFAAQSHC